MSNESVELEMLREEVRQLMEVNHELSEEISDLQAQLEESEHKIRALKATLLDVEDFARKAIRMANDEE